PSSPSPLLKARVRALLDGERRRRPAMALRPVVLVLVMFLCMAAASALLGRLGSRRGPATRGEPAPPRRLTWDRPPGALPPASPAPGAPAPVLAPSPPTGGERSAPARRTWDRPPSSEERRPRTETAVAPAAAPRPAEESSEALVT